MKTCPYCAEEIQDEAIVCKHCGRDLASPKTKKSPPSKKNSLLLGAVLMFLICCGVMRAATATKTSEPTKETTGANSVVISTFTPAAIDTPIPTEAAVYTNTPKPHYRIIAKQAIDNMVVIDPKYNNDRQVLLDISKEICDGEDICVVLFWDDESKAPRSLPMTDQQVNDQIAQYNINKNSGLDRLLLCNQGSCN